MEKVKSGVVIIGATGLLGQPLAAQSSQLFDTIALTHKDLDITETDRVYEKICSLKPKVIVLTAAYSDVDGCEINPGRARAVNVHGVKNVARAAGDIGAALISLSTDHVFDGKSNRPYKEEDPTGPVNVYGQTKWEGERVVQTSLTKYIIVRTTWLFGGGNKGFVPYVLSSIRQKKPMSVIADKVASPTYTVDLSTAICDLVRFVLNGRYDFKKYSIVHIVNTGTCSWFDIARFVLDELNIRDLELSPAALDVFLFKAKRPRYSALDNSLFAEITGKQMRNWQTALKEFILCQRI